MKFIDLFAGIGGFHIALSEIGGECVFGCEINKAARDTYKANGLDSYGRFEGDIRKVDISSIPDFDILCGGFPCQPFSVAGRQNGFEDARGTLIYEIAKILDAKQPSAFILENVRGLQSINKGIYFNSIKSIINGLGYSFYYKVLKASDFGLPQRRERLYMVGFKNNAPFVWPDPIPRTLTMSDILGGNCPKEIGYTLRVGGRQSGIDNRHNWDRYTVDGREVELTPKHGLAMMGFPSDFIFPVSDNQALKLLGNSVAIPVVREVGKNVVEAIDHNT